MRCYSSLLVAVLVYGCGEDDDPCKAPVDCDISNAECQAQVFEATACARDQSDATMPPIRTQTSEQFRADIVAAAGEPDERDRAWEETLKLLAFLPDSSSNDDASTDVAVDNVAAYYHDEDKSITIIERDGVTDPKQDVFILSHEFTHALQDQDVGLQKFRNTYVESTDSSMAIRTLVEGEATVVSNVVLANAMGRSAADLDWVAYASSMRTILESEVAESDVPFLTAIQIAPYAYGVAGLHEPWLDGGRASIGEFYQKPRTSLIDWNAGSALGETAVEALDCTPSRGPAGYLAYDKDRFGPIGALATFLGSGPAQGRLSALPAFMRGDTIVIFRPEADGDESVAVAWTTRWTDAGNANTFARAATDLMPAAQIQVNGVEVGIHVATKDPLSLNWAFECGTPDELPSSPSGSPTESAIARKLKRPRLSARRVH